jgi:hypothetical protein
MWNIILLFKCISSLKNEKKSHTHEYEIFIVILSSLNLNLEVGLKKRYTNLDNNKCIKWLSVDKKK